MNAKINALNPNPGTWFELKKFRVKILKARIIEKNHNCKPGEVLNKNFTIACSRNALQVIELQKEEKKVCQLQNFSKAITWKSGQFCKMFNYLIKVEYDGTNFVGWQYQKNGISIQEKIEQVFRRILNKKIKIVGAGRTDKGVHALNQCAHFKISTEIKDLKKFLNSVNFFLKKFLITIIEIKKKKFRFSCKILSKRENL